MTTRGHRLRAVSTFTETHFGRRVTIPGDPDITGILAGLIPVRDRVQAVLLGGNSRVYTSAMPGSTHVEVWQKEGR